MAPNFEIFQEIETIRMVSFFQPSLRLSALGTPGLRTAAPEGWGDDPYSEFEEVHDSRIEDCDPQAHGFVALLKITSTPIREVSSLAGGRPSPARNRVSDLMLC